MNIYFENLCKLFNKLQDLTSHDNIVHYSALAK